MKLIIDVDEKIVCKGFEQPLTEEERATIIRAIGNGRSYNPSGDLISRSALLKDLDEYNEFAVFDCEAVKDLINDAPTVNFMISPDYVTELQNRNKELIKQLEEAERPQGEWIKVKEERMSIDMSGEIATRYKCSKCGRFITILPSKLSDYPFCHCGADMRKGSKND